jgi:hypothetical protein
MTLASLASTAIIEYGRNDISGGASLASVQSTAVTLWSMFANRGQRVFQTTITPRTTSTDGWVTTGSQTAAAGESVRVAFNAWLRAGAPVSSGVAVAIGTSGALLAGQTGHPLYGVFEVADICESTRDSGLWKAMVSPRTVTDAVATNGSGTITSATANFQTSDIGRTITVTGAGTAGALHVALILTRNSATSISVDFNPATSVSGATMKIGDAAVLDGIHPTPYMAALMAAAVDTTQIV